MSILMALTEWALRSSALILCGAGLLWLLRVKDAFIRLTAWKALLAGSLAIPALTLMLPKVPVAVMQADLPLIPRPIPLVPESLPEPVHAAAAVARHFDWAQIAVAIYAAVALFMFLRLLTGLVLSRRLLRGSVATGRMFVESGRVAAPVTLGIVRPVIVLPHDWHEWEEAKLDAVLAHERSHIRRHDPAVQMLSAIHRSVLWIGPLSWFLHNRIVRTAEEASDDAAVAATRDRAFYAEVLLAFIQRGVRGVNWLGVPMARYGWPDRRIHRILDGTTLSPAITRWAVAAIMAVTPLLAYLDATAYPSQAAPQAPARSAQPAPVPTAPIPPAQTNTPESAIRKPREAPIWLNGIGDVAAMYTVRVLSRVEGQVASVDFTEGGPVEAGQLLASIESPQLQTQLDRAMNQLSEDRQAQNEAAIRADEAAVAEAQRQLAWTKVTAPISGVAGSRQIDPRNFVHAGDTLLVIMQLQPIAVVFKIPEDFLLQVRALLRSRANPVVEAWNRDNSVQLGIGRLTAMDNTIDPESGTIKLKASFENKDGALFPGQFVNVRVLMSSR